jgi:hypothetical protein
LASVLAYSPPALAQTETAHNEQVLYSFQGLPNDGYQPVGAVVFDAAGNLYGATAEGGSSSCPSIQQCGTVYELSPPAVKGEPWTETVLYVFKGNKFNDGTSPYGGLVIDSAGNLYGTTGYGGTGNCVLVGISVGCGTVYELSPPAQKDGTWTEQVLYSFPTPEEGYAPFGDLVFDNSGNLYGATAFGGGYGTTCDIFYQYCGAIFELSPPQQMGGAWTEQVLHGFKGTAFGVLTGDGGSPNGGLIFDGAGNIYGTTMDGGFAGGECRGVGQGGPGCGTVFRLVPPVKQGQPWTEEILYSFSGQDGATPLAGVVLGASGSLFGSTSAGGYPAAAGTVFELQPHGTGHSWEEQMLHVFTDGWDGSNPSAKLTLDTVGNLYGTTRMPTNTNAKGTAFRMSQSGQSNVFGFDLIYTFRNIPDGEDPASPLIFDKEGNLYGTTQDGGTGTTCNVQACGTVFVIRP